MSTLIRTFLLEPFDIMLHASEDGVNVLQARFATWLKTLAGEARFLCWQMPATLDDKIRALNQEATRTDDPQRWELLVEYCREYERMNRGAEYHAEWRCGAMAIRGHWPVGWRPHSMASHPTQPL